MERSPRVKFNIRFNYPFMQQQKQVKLGFRLLGFSWALCFGLWIFIQHLVDYKIL